MKEFMTGVFLMLIFLVGCGVGFVAGISATGHALDQSAELNVETKALLKRAKRQACGIYL